MSTFVPKNRLCYYHSFAMTPNYFVFIENPFVVNVWALLTMKIKGRSFHECIRRVFILSSARREKWSLNTKPRISSRSIT